METDKRLEAIDEASVWLGDELAADPSWRVVLSETQQSELLVATENVRERGLTVGRFGHTEFPLPEVGPILKKLVHGVENGRGVGLLRGVPVEQIDETGLQLMYWGIGGYLGQLISQNSRGQLLAQVSDRGNSYADRNTRGFSTNAELYPHVDTSDMTSLLCVRGAKSGGHSRVVSSTATYNTILSENPEFLDVLYRGFHNDLRGEGPTGEIDELTHEPIPVFSYFADRVSCSFNYRMIENGADKRGIPLTGLERDALDLLRDITLRPSHGYRFMMEPGDIQMVSNHCVFHSREAYEDHANSEAKRCLYRLWVNLNDGRPLASNFANRYNTGPRGGVARGSGARYKF